ncbi:glutamate receptor ionotropic, kainate glr-3-like isoform X2 [Tigriopus californicus]|nr:glutamate receptor ionotropic, kainate glr-3-like isoform X2 [Tigriopus californicus]
MNFTFLLNPPPDRAWGTKLPDGKWNGMIGQLHRREIDIAPAEFTVTALRSEVVDFNVPITESHQKLFVKNPAESFNWTAFIEPLSWSCWGVIALFIIFVPLAMAPAIRLGNEPEQEEFTLSKSFCFVAGAMTIARGWNTTPWRIQNRILFFSVMLGGTLIYWHWEAMIISFLAVRTTVLPFSSMEEMLTKTDFKVAVQPGTSYVDTFRHSNNPMLKRIWTERIEPYIADYPQSKIGLSMKIIEESGYALFDNFFTTISYEPYEECQIIAVPVAYFPVQFAYAFQKKSPYFDAFWYQLNKMKERGATKQILEKYEAGKQVCPDYSGKPLGFGQCFTAFIALMGGMLLGFLCLG